MSSSLYCPYSGQEQDREIVTRQDPCPRANYALQGFLVCTIFLHSVSLFTYSLAHEDTYEKKRMNTEHIS